MDPFDSSDRRRRGRAPGSARASGSDRSASSAPDVELGDGCELVSHVVVAGHTHDRRAHEDLPVRLHRPCAAGPEIHAASRRRSRSASDCIIREGVTMNPGTRRAAAWKTVVGDRCSFLAQLACGARLPRRQQRDPVQQRHARRATARSAISPSSAAAPACIQFVRVGAHAFVGGLSGVENDVIPYGMAHRQPGAPRRPQHHRPAAARLHPRADPRYPPRLPPALRR